MNVRTLVGAVAAVLLVCSNTSMGEPGAGPRSIKAVKAEGIEPVQAEGIEPVQAQGIKKYTPRHRQANAKAKERGRVIDPKGQGLTQAQIDAMEAQRQLMWNATGGGMVYR